MKVELPSFRHRYRNTAAHDTLGIQCPLSLISPSLLFSLPNRGKKPRIQRSLTNSLYSFLCRPTVSLRCTSRRALTSSSTPSTSRRKVPLTRARPRARLTLPLTLLTRVSPLFPLCQHGRYLDLRDQLGEVNNAGAIHVGKRVKGNAFERGCRNRHLSEKS